MDRTRSLALVGVVAGLVLVGGCGGRTETASREPRGDLAQKAVLAAANQIAAPVSGGKAPSATDLAPKVADGDDNALARVEDPLDDHGDGPRYADLVGVIFADGDAGLTVSLLLADVVPGRLRRGEIEDVGVDVFRISPLDTILGHRDSDYEIRLDGGAYGWRAFLRIRDGYVEFPGTFTVSGHTLRVVLPWEAIGGRDGAEVEAFVDWSSGVGSLATDGTTRVRLDPGR
jgi:hypothetical protein